MRRERVPVVRHRRPDATWWTIALPELEALVGRDPEAGAELARGMMKGLDSDRGCGPIFGRGCSTSLGPLDACEACRRVDDAIEAASQLWIRARLAGYPFTPPDVAAFQRSPRPLTAKEA